MIPQAQSIDEVIVILKNIIAENKNEASPLAYFAVLYCRVTEKVKEGIEQGIFQDNPRMEKLDVVFANRYIEAYYTYKNAGSPSACWEVAFKESNNYWLIVLQHLLLGMNAHINLDLGIAAAQVCPKEAIHGLESDFNKINEILASLVGNAEKALSDIWPTLKWILTKTQNVDNFLVDFSMQTAREGAWKFALKLAPLDANSFEKAVKERDLSVTEITKIITNQNIFVQAILKFIRLFERGTVDQKIALLEETI
ncbi:MAG: DUF5995 family protein [Chitinophagales bacterium]|jgi:hypothetical protein|nr:DUF5995 family protein [Sphingobacteriales bacterium]